MKPLFFVHTPFQMYVAQQIIAQEKYSEVVFILGTIRGNKSFYSSYDLMLADVPFNYKTYKLDSLAELFTIVPRLLFKDIRKCIRNTKFLNNILKSNGITTIYIGDYKNRSYKFLISAYSKKGYDINIYEEGSIHYNTLEPTPRKSIGKSILAAFVDCLFYLPLYRIKYGRKMFDVEVSTFDNLPLTKRYSIVDKFHTAKDVKLNISKLNNSVLKNYILNDLSFDITDKRTTLFLSEPIFRDICGSEELYLSVIEQYLQQDSTSDLYLIKYHPRESDDTRNKIEALFKRLNKPYVLLSANVPLPIELYFEYISPDKLVLFMTSTYLYVGAISPNTQLVILIRNYADLCRKKGYDTAYLDALIENLLPL